VLKDGGDQQRADPSMRPGWSNAHFVRGLALLPLGAVRDPTLLYQIGMDVVGILVAQNIVEAFPCRPEPARPLSKISLKCHVQPVVELAKDRGWCWAPVGDIWCTAPMKTHFTRVDLRLEVAFCSGGFGNAASVRGRAALGTAPPPEFEGDNSIGIFDI